MRFLRGSKLALAPIAVLLATSPAANAVTFDEKIAMVYDIAPKLRIMGSGFDTLQPSNVKLSFAPSVKDSDYSLDIPSSTVMTLSLKEGKKWVTVEPGSPPTRLYLSSVKNEGTVLTEETVQVATVVPAPTVQSSSKEIYMKTTPRVIVNGMNFNTKNTELYFDPPLNEGTVIQKQVLSSTQISISKIYNIEQPNVWAIEPGPLKVKGINTGGGILQLNPQDGGVIVAEVQADLEGHGVTVNSHEALDIYQSTKKLQITGKGFKDGVKVRFANALRGGGTNFTITETQPESITLELKDGSKWRKNVDSLPGPLVLLAADVGDGWVPLGPTAAKAGRKVATVFEDPSVEPSNIEVFRTHTHELMIKGTGFNKLARPIIDFHPPLDSYEVSVQVLDRTSIMLSLSSTTSEWTTEDEVGSLTVKGIDTGAGMVKFDAPIQVAKVVSDSEVHTSGVQVYPSYGEVRYQSSKEPLRIFGSGFKGEPVLSFDPPIWSPANYTLIVVSDTELKLVLAEGSLWSKYPRHLILKGIDVGDGEVSLAGGKGVKVATILETPSIKQADMHIYTTHTKHFPVRGTGFVSVLDPGKLPIVVVDDISSANFKVQENWHNGVMNLQLLHGPWSTLNAGETKHLKIMSIDTGAGVVNFPGGVQIAIVREDSSFTLCDDSCAFAQDGQCDEPVQGSSRFPRSRRQRMSMSDDSLFAGMAPCEIGTDCTDCGVKVVVDGTCLNTCRHARDGFCDDPRAGGVCPGGTDCQDCGPWGDGNSNFTRTTTSSTTSWFNDDTSWFNDDDWNSMVNDDGIKNENILFEIAQPRTGLRPLVMEE